MNWNSLKHNSENLKHIFRNSSKTILYTYKMYSYFNLHISGQDGQIFIYILTVYQNQGCFRFQHIWNSNLCKSYNSTENKIYKSSYKSKIFIALAAIVLRWGHRSALRPSFHKRFRSPFWFGTSQTYFKRIISFAILCSFKWGVTQ